MSCDFVTGYSRVVKRRPLLVRQERGAMEGLMLHQGFRVVLPTGISYTKIFNVLIE